MKQRVKGEDFAAAYGLKGELGSSLGVCKKGYELARGQTEDMITKETRPVFYLVPKCEREERSAWTWYYPLQEHRNLFLEFARLREVVRSDQAQPQEIALEWTNKYGLLGCNLRFHQDRHTFEREVLRPYESVDEFFEEVDRAAAVVAFYEAVLNGDEAAILPLLRRFPTWPVSIWTYYWATDAADLYGGNLGSALYLVTNEVVRMINTFAYPKLTLQPGPATPSTLTSGYGFHTLLGALYLQMYWLVAAGEKHVTRCGFCGKLIRLTADEPETEGGARSRKPRQDKRFCDRNCRQRNHYQTKTKPRRERERSQKR